jgi:hypothetical protein
MKPADTFTIALNCPGLSWMKSTWLILVLLIIVILLLICYIVKLSHSGDIKKFILVFSKSFYWQSMSYKGLEINQLGQILTYWLSTTYKKEAQGGNPRPVTNHKTEKIMPLS